MDRAAMKQVSYQGYMQLRIIPVKLFKKTELIQQLLGGMLVFAVTGIDKRGRYGQTISSGKLPAVVFQPPAYPFEFATDDKNAVLVSGEGIEGVRIALLFIDRAMPHIESVQLNTMKLGCILK